jgi:competence protein ComEC
MRLSYKDTSIMLMGDATAETEKLIISGTDPKNIASDILKLGHHGSRTSTSEEWLDVVAPTVAIVSAGENNSYGHPHPEVVDRLAERGIEVRQTGIDGTISYISDGQEWIEK